MIPCDQPETKVRKVNNSSQLQSYDDLHRTLIREIISTFSALSMSIFTYI